MPRQATPLTDTKIKSLKPRAERYRKSDTGGLMIEILPSGSKVWRYRFQLHGVRQPSLTIGNYPEVGLAEARKRRDEWAGMVARGESPKRAVQAAKSVMLNTVKAFGTEWLNEQVVGKSDSYVTTMRRLMTKDVFPTLGSIPLASVKPADILELCDKIKSRGSPKMALLTRNVLRRMYDYAIARQLAETNPAAALVARFIATEESRTRVLSPVEIGQVLRAIYLSSQTRAMLSELKTYSGRSAFLFPSTRGDADRPISKSTLNQAVRALSIDVQHFVLHDFRRTASTHLHEMGHSSDAIERALAHKIQGIKGVYNRAEYADQRRVILQAWADFVQAQLDDATITPLFRSAC